MSTTNTPFILRITRHLHWPENLCYAMLSISGILVLMDMNAESLILFSMSGLAIVFFLYAQRPPEMSNTGEEPLGFKALLTMSVIPKVLWISLSVSTIAILFHYLQLNDTGSKQMLLIGGSSLFMGMLLLGILTLGGGVKDQKSLLFVVARAIPVLIIDSYLFFS